MCTPSQRRIEAKAWLSLFFGGIFCLFTYLLTYCLLQDDDNGDDDDDN